MRYVDRAENTRRFTKESQDSERQWRRRRPTEWTLAGTQDVAERTVQEERELALDMTGVRLFRWTEDRHGHTAARLRLRLRLRLSPAC